MKTCVLFLRVLIGLLLVASCDPSPDKSGNDYVYIWIKNDLNVGANVTAEKLNDGSLCVTSYAQPATISLNAGEKSKVLIHVGKRSGSYKDGERVTSVCFDEQDYSKYTLCYDEATQTHHIYSKDANCDVGQVIPKPDATK